MEKDTMSQDWQVPTREVKIQTFDIGHPNWDYQCMVPPVHTTMWNTLNWIDWIDTNGRWFKRKVNT
jgi:hypothetical protein